MSMWTCNDGQTKEKEVVNQIDSIKKAYSNIDAYERISNISNNELTEMYHLYLEKIEYYPITTMKGFYKVLFKSGMIFYFAITKVRRSPAAYVVDADVNIETGDMTFKYDIATTDGTFSFSPTQVKTVNIKDFFQSEWTEYAFAVRLNLDLSYRERYVNATHLQCLIDQGLDTIFYGIALLSYIIKSHLIYSFCFSILSFLVLLT